MSSSHYRNFRKAVGIGKSVYDYAKPYIADAKYAYNEVKNLRKQAPVRSIQRVVARQQKQVNQVRHIVDCLKRYNYLYANGTTDTTGDFTLINGMVQGDTDGTREGQCIYLKSIGIKMGLWPLSSATNSVSTVRVMLIYDKQSNGAILPINQVLLDTTAGIRSMISPRHPDFKKRFVVMYDKIVKLIATANTGATAGANVANLPVKMFKISKTFKKGFNETQYNGGNAGTVADITRGALYLYVLGDTAVANPWHAQILMFYSE